MPIKTGSLSNIDSSQSGNLSNELLTAILSSAEELVTGHGLLDSLNSLLAELGRLTGVSRVWVFQTLELRDDFILQDYIFEWAAEDKYIQIGLPHFNHFRSEINTPEYSALVESRKRGEYQDLITEQLPDSWLKSYLQSQKILSMLTIPIIVDNQWWGTLGLDDCERAVKWSATEIILLRTASFFISSAVVRDNLRAKRSQLNVLKQNTACSTWEFDIRRGHLWCTSEVLLPSSDTVHNLHFTLRLGLKRIHPDYRHFFLRQIRRFAHNQSSLFRCDIKVLRDDNTYGWIEVSANTQSDTTEKGNVLAGIFWDITARKEAEVRLEHEATTDPLTGIMNRRKFDLEIQNQCLALKEKHQIFSLAIADIDHFKQINDTYGHVVGDRILQHFTNIAQQSFRSGDTFARIGGEEFAVLLPNTQEKAAVTICNRMRELIKNTPYIHQDKKIPFTVSIGCTTLRDTQLHSVQAFENADCALYQAKQNGRDRVELKN